MRYFTVVLGVIGLFFSSAAWAQSKGEGVLNAVSYRPLQAGIKIAVEPYDNSAANIKLKGHFEEALRKAGYEISDSANIIMSFESRDEAGAWVQPGKRTYIELHNNPERRGVEPPKVLLNLYNSDRGGVLNSGRGNREVTPRKYRLDTTIDNKSNGRRMWHAWTITNVGASDSSALAASMIPMLVKNLGQTVRGQAFEIK
jgi:hypothetical protein